MVYVVSYSLIDIFLSTSLTLVRKTSASLVSFPVYSERSEIGNTHVHTRTHGKRRKKTRDGVKMYFFFISFNNQDTFNISSKLHVETVIGTLQVYNKMSKLVHHYITDKTSIKITGNKGDIKLFS